MSSGTVSRLAVRTPTLPPATHTNAYLMGSRELVLIEPATPYADETAALFAFVDDALARGGELVAVLLTHHHVDHIGAAQAVLGRYGVPLWAHRETASRLPSELHVARFLEEGDSIDLDGPEATTLRAIFTPGHAPGHLCYFDERSGDLVAGDMVASEGTILVEARDGDMALYLGSLARLRAIGARRLLPAHGAPIDDPTAKIDGYVAHRAMREARVVAALGEILQEATLDELVALAYADTPSAIWPLAKLSLEAHLIKLEREGRAIRTRDDAWRNAS